MGNLPPFNEFVISEMQIGMDKPMLFICVFKIHVTSWIYI